uniref:Uncharacterized protein n=1 Tax=Agrobacterium genomosp. 6 TaxID=1183411 RepID=A0A2Z2PDN7_9HYPH|nr:hypothetical protein [Agrobacterium genomosp. 6]ASK41484.1 hypothetical protein [Agrobacterium genomosp. 6]
MPESSTNLAGAKACERKGAIAHLTRTREWARRSLPFGRRAASASASGMDARQGEDWRSRAEAQPTARPAGDARRESWFGYQLGRRNHRLLRKPFTTASSLTLSPRDLGFDL